MNTAALQLPPAFAALATADDRTAYARWQSQQVDSAIADLCLAGRVIDALIVQHRHRHPHIVVACFPKSASTFLNAALVHVTGYRSYLLNTAGYDNERNIDRLAVPMFLAQPTVSQEHMRATQPNLALLEALDLRPVVLVRNLFDCIISSRDHALNESIIGPNAHAPRTFAAWPSEEQNWFLIRMAAPWYLTFYTSWLDAAKNLPTLFITYEQVVHHAADTVAAILDHTGINNFPRANIERSLAAFSAAGTRLNQGVSGRGCAELSPAQQQALRDLASVYRNTYDLSRIGL